MATTVLKPSVEDLTNERDALLAGLTSDLTDVKARAERFLVTADEARVLRRLDEIAYLLGEK